MNQPSKSFKSILFYYLKWITIAAIVGVCSGFASAAFLATLEEVTRFRESHGWLLYGMPLGGLLVGGAYHIFGREVEGGNNLIIDEFHDPKAVIPFRMAPLVLIGTVLTHLFGGSAGREGTAVQMGGAIADQFTHSFKLDRSERRTLLMAGMSGGFGSVFGVPFAGMVFGIEVLAVGKLHLWAVVECAVAAFVAHYVTLAIGIHHTHYFKPLLPELTVQAGLLVVMAGIVFGLAARLFAFLSHQIQSVSKLKIPHLPIRALIGGAIISTIFFIVPSIERYAGLGVPIIAQAIEGRVMPYDWIGKLVFTALTLGFGFKGGEVTPLLFIGATLGNALSSILPLPLPLLSSVGFVAVFAGAANTPIACTIMAMEIFGKEIGLFAALACFASYAASGHRGIYRAQKVHIHKSKDEIGSFKRIHFFFQRPPLDEKRSEENEHGNE